VGTSTTHATLRAVVLLTTDAFIEYNDEDTYISTILGEGKRIESQSFFGQRRSRSRYDFLSTPVTFPKVNNENLASSGTSKSEFYLLKGKGLIRGEGLKIPKQASGSEMAQVCIDSIYFFQCCGPIM